MANKERSDKETTDKELEDLHDRLGKVFPGYAKIHKEVDIELKEKGSESKDNHKADKGIPVNIMPRIKKSCNKIHQEADNESQERPSSPRTTLKTLRQVKRTQRMKTSWEGSRRLPDPVSPPHQAPQ